MLEPSVTLRCLPVALVLSLLATPVLAQTAPPDSSFQKVVLQASINQPTEVAVAPDLRVFFLDRLGKVNVYLPASSTTVVAGTLAVDETGNHGLIGLALDPGFATNGWIYLYYAPPTPSVSRLSRFTVVGNTMDLTSERVLLSFPTTRICCHEGGSLTFGPDGTLYMATGDNTEPGQSSGYAPIDERAGRANYDAQKSSSNTKDMRGKILRIKPEADGTYSIPPGNLFTDPSQGLPEIYVMGTRNSFRISVDKVTGWLYFGDVGPDANTDSATQGPRGYDEVNQVRSAGNYGWPYCVADNKAYRDFNFATGTSSSSFNCAAPVNNSPNNTGIQNLPPARPAMIWYPYGASVEFPGVGNVANDRAAMVGSFYRFDPLLDSAVKLPAYFDNKLFFFDYTRDWIQTVRLDASGNYAGMERFLPSFSFIQPIDAEIGPDGALYVLEWGNGQGHESGPEAKLSRVEFKGTMNASPTAVATANPTAGAAPLVVTFSSAGSSDPEGGALTYAWDFTNDGIIDSTAASASFNYETVGDYVARLTVTDPLGKTGTASVNIPVGNAPPVVTMSTPPNGGFFTWEQKIPVTVSVTDAEDGSTATGGISCAAVQMVPGLGHDQHSHSEPSNWGCQGAIRLPPAPTDHANADIYWVLESKYTDRGGQAGPATGSATVKLQPARKQAEFYSSSSGVSKASSTDGGTGQMVTNISNGDWIAFFPMNLKNITQLTFRAATSSTSTSNKIEVRHGSPTGALIGTLTLTSSGGMTTFKDYNLSVTDPGGTKTLYFVFRAASGSSVYNLNWIEFKGPGITLPMAPSGTAGSTYEAEKATLSGVTVATNQAGYTGTGFADYNTSTGSYVEWKVEAPVAGSYPLEFRYANGGTTNRPLSIKVGATTVVASQAFNPTGSWTTWRVVRVNANLVAGQNTIRATATATGGGPNVDSLSLPVFQAETANLSSARIESVHTGYTGTAYAGFAATSGAFVEWTVEAPTAGSYTLEMRYALGDPATPTLELMVGTTVVNGSLAFSPTGSWSTWSTRTIPVTLAAGASKIRLSTTGQGGPNIDYLLRR